MLDLKAKLLAAGLVTADQVKKVEEDESTRKARQKEQRELRAKGGDKRDKKGNGHRRDDDEKRAARDHKEEEAQRWRKRLDDLKAAGKSEQYQVIRGWVDRHRVDSRTAVPSEGASRFHFARDDGTIGHITLEPDVQARLSGGEAGIIAFMGNNGLEHAVVPADLARDILHVKPEWLRSLVGVTDLDPPATETPVDSMPPTDAPMESVTPSGPEGDAAV